MAKIKISVVKQELKYKKLHFPFNAVKRVLLNSMQHELYATKAIFDKHCIHRKFNSTTGEIERKYAWDSLFEELKSSGALAAVLDDIIYDEYLK